MGIVDAVLVLGLTIIQPKERQAKTFVGLLLVSAVFWGLRAAGIF